MGSKHLESIIANIPPATVTKEFKKVEDISTKSMKRSGKIVRVVATVDTSVKKELKELAENMETTESVVILKALKNFGFKSIDDSMLVDKRTTR